MSRYGTSVVNALRQALRPVSIAGLPPETLFDDLWAFLQTTSAGATALPADIDSLCRDGGAFGYDPTTSVGLVFGFKAGRIMVGNVVKSLAAGTLALAASNTNYVEVDGAGAGTVSANTTAFTSGRMPLYLVVTGVAAISTVTNAKVLLETPTPASIPGLLLSAAAATRTLSAQLGVISATTSFEIVSPGFAAVLAAAVLDNSVGFATDNTNYWSFFLTNAGPAGTGATAMLDTTALNTTQTTGGSALTAHVARPLVKNATAGNLVTAANDVVIFTVTKVGAPANLTAVNLRLDFAFTV